MDGSDRAHSAKTDRLETLGITVEFGQRAENVAQAETVVYSSAIKPDNPEIVAAHAAGKRIVHRSDILALLMNGKRAVTVAGAHGKTTTSSMLSHILVNAGAIQATPSAALSKAGRHHAGRRTRGQRRHPGGRSRRIGRQLRQIPSDHRHYHQL